MKSMQILFVCAFVVLCSANPIPDEAVTSTPPPAVELAQSTPVDKTADVPAPVPEVKSADVPAVNAPANETPTVKSEEKIPEPQALPSKSVDNSTPTAEEKKREIQEPVVGAEQTVKPVEQAKSVQPTEVVKSDQPAQSVGTDTQKSLETVSQASEQKSVVEQKPEVEQKPVESVAKSLIPESKAPESVVPAVEAKQAAIPAVESTVVPAGVASEKKIEAEAPAPIVSENVQIPNESELKSVPEVPAAPVVAALSSEPTPNSSLKSTSNEKTTSGESEQNSSENSSEESKESKESDDKKQA